MPRSALGAVTIATLSALSFAFACGGDDDAAAPVKAASGAAGRLNSNTAGRGTAGTTGFMGGAGTFGNTQGGAGRPANTMQGGAGRTNFQGGNQMGSGGAVGGIDCGDNPRNGDSCSAPGVCMGTNGCQCQVATLQVVGCTTNGSGGMAPAGGRSSTGGGSGTGGVSGTAGGPDNGGVGNEGNNGGAGNEGNNAGQGPGNGVNCGATPANGNICQGGPGACPNGDDCVCLGDGSIQCHDGGGTVACGATPLDGNLCNNGPGACPGDSVCICDDSNTIQCP